MGVDLNDLPSVTGPVIVIEDEAVVRMLLAETLTEIGLPSVTFDNAASAWTHLLAINGKCSLIIADQGLPGGIQGAEFIRMATDQWPFIASILTSGYLIDDQVIPPATIYLHKPYTLDELESTIAAVLKKNSTSSTDGA